MTDQHHTIFVVAALVAAVDQITRSGHFVAGDVFGDVPAFSASRSRSMHERSRAPSFSRWTWPHGQRTRMNHPRGERTWI